ncbi:hypothetical protein Aspvir_007446 [Aspergillus viridinutans]|uniref:Uncharacterized protein n=1 Tax=Aspergillus viridinutans TaxID=75553 RepID=A0A9P3C0P9_ASPVI|nr:uncharacterized protein Aspvir_007446 [Aspergillus viridinutans]GIK03377.1 hypothetical protein Aspvir_007446 [Aspergillus viridinutans]
MLVVCEFILVSLFPPEQVLVTSTAQKCELDAGVGPPVEAPVLPSSCPPAPDPPTPDPPAPASPDPPAPASPDPPAPDPPDPDPDPPAPAPCPASTSLTPSRAASRLATVWMNDQAALLSRGSIVLFPSRFQASLAALPPLTPKCRATNPPPTNPRTSTPFWAHSQGIVWLS